MAGFFDADTVMAIAAEHDILVTVEENVLPGGFGSAVAEFVSDLGLLENDQLTGQLIARHVFPTADHAETEILDLVDDPLGGFACFSIGTLCRFFGLSLRSLFRQLGL